MITIDDIFKLIFWSYWGGMLLLMVLAYWVLTFFVPKGKRRWAVLVAVLGVGLAFVLPIVNVGQKQYRQKKQYQARYQAAKAVFDERCKNAGEKIYRTAENVEGVMLMKVRPRANSVDLQDPMWPDAAKAFEGGDTYLAHFLPLFSKQIYAKGYQYVDVLQEDRSIIRFSGDWYYIDKPFHQEPNPKNPARYAVDYTNDVNPQDRQHWVAGTIIRIVDRHTNEVMAEKVIYTFDEALGSTATARSPWKKAVRCPRELDHEQYTVLFVNKVLQPSIGENHE